MNNHDNHSPHLAIVRTASPRCEANLASVKLSFQHLGFNVDVLEGPADPTWPYTAGSPEQRAQRLVEALENRSVTSVLCARGGYGCSDLLPLLPWTGLAKIEPKLIIGFSDTSALHAAFWTKLSWKGLHAPMPATELWQQEGEDVQTLISLLTGARREVKIRLNQNRQGDGISGWLFGGCWSVLTNLIGTPYFPPNLEGAILFLEDTDESAPRLLRYWNQWVQSGATQGIKALVLGNFRNCGMEQKDFMAQLIPQLSARSSIPVFTTPDFGHTAPNIPLMIGAKAHINRQQLVWQMQEF